MTPNKIKIALTALILILFLFLFNQQSFQKDKLAEQTKISKTSTKKGQISTSSAAKTSQAENSQQGSTVTNQV